MGKKVKIGKQRRDKAYWAAKEIGYRSRASFKLVQLNRKWEFLQKSAVCIDLCAAPGSWMQVCRENMPMSSLVVGVDLAPIKPLPGCIALQEDITTEKCKASIKKELKTAKADLVLHDGAPNVGKNWIHDAYQQSLLTLSAFKLATCFLSKGGWFVTKVFRSKDYQSLIWVFSQFFKKVHATKPAASRNESAEIFVVCQYYLAPDKIDPKFLDAKHVFSEIETENRKLTHEIINPEKAKKKPCSEGYAEGVTLLFREAKASDFILGDDPIKILNSFNRISIDAGWIQKHGKTTKEVEECLKDLKVLGMKDLRLLKKWRDSLRKEYEKSQENKESKEGEEGEEGKEEKTEDQIEEEELDEIDKKVAEMQDEERRREKRKRKKERKEQQKRVQRLNLKMVIPGDEGPRAEEHGLFQVSDLRSKQDLEDVLDSKPDEIAENSDEEIRTKRKKFERFDREKGERNDEGLWYEEHGDVIQDSSDEDSDRQDEDLGLQPDDDEDDTPMDNTVEDTDPTESNPLLTSLSQETTEQRRARKAELWFQKIGDLEEDSDLEDKEMERAVTRVENKGGKMKKKQEKKEKEKMETHESGYTSGSEDEGDDQPLDMPRSKKSKKSKPTSDSDSSDSDSDSDESDYEDNAAGGGGVKVDAGGFEIVSQPKVKKRKALSAEQLALGEELIKSKKRKRDIMDAGWNRYMFDDSGLPDWFTKDEEVHYKRRVELDAATVEKYKEREKELNVKTIKKVVEAKARRKKRMVKKLDKAKKKAAALLENSDIGSHEKAREIKKMYKQAEAEGKRKKEVKYVVAKKHQAGRGKPSGTKGPYKQVDPRMKKDNKSKRDNATKKRGQKRRLKGKHAKPTKQFNTNRPPKR